MCPRFGRMHDNTSLEEKLLKCCALEVMLWSRLFKKEVINMNNQLRSEIEECERTVDDGIYDVTGLEFLEVTGTNDRAIEAFVKKFPGYYLASAYETECDILLSAKPKKFDGRINGSGFNYGSTNVLTRCPEAILILAEND